MIEKKLFGLLDGKEVYSFTLKNQHLEVEILNYGGVIRTLKVQNGKEKTDVVLGFDKIEDYCSGRGYHGAIVGRFANRIKDGAFYIGDKKYQLSKNENGNCLHGGFNGFSKKIWDYQIEDQALVLSLVSPDGDEGFPGNLKLTVKYSLTDDQLTIEYFAVSDKDTVASFTNHSYFNLNGAGKGNVCDHYLTLNATEYTPIDENRVPTGEILSVYGTPFDFTTKKKIGTDINAKHPQFTYTKGYDHNYALSGNGYRQIAQVIGDKTGLEMSVFSDACGVQLFTANADKTVVGKQGKTYGKHGAFCLETEFFPNSINCKNFPSPILKKDQPFYSKTAFVFKV